MRELPILSDTRSEILFTLAAVSEGEVHLRLIQALCERGIRSVQLALKDLQRIGLIKGKRSGRNTLYSLNKNHQDYHFVQSALTLRSAELIKRRALGYRQAARDTLNFIESSSSLFAKIKSEH